MPSNCTRDPVRVFNVNTVKIGLLKNYSFKYTKDHSKWAVSMSPMVNVTCIGGVNRQPSQDDRGGGLMCFANNFNVAEAYRSIIKDTSPCGS